MKRVADLFQAVTPQPPGERDRHIPRLVKHPPPRAGQSLFVDAGSNRVPVDVSHNLHQRAVGITEDRLVSAPKQGAVNVVGAVEILGVDAIDVPHAPGQIAIRCLDQEVIRHQTVGRYPTSHLRLRSFLAIYRCSSFLVVMKNRALPYKLKYIPHFCERGGNS